MKVGREQERDRGKRDQRRQRGHRLVPLELKSERVGEAEHRRCAHRQRFEREIEDPRQEPDHAADQQFDRDHLEGEDRIVAERGVGHALEQERRQRQGHRKRDEQADLRGNLGVREPGASIRQAPMRQKRTKAPIAAFGASASCGPASAPETSAVTRSSRAT